MNKKTIKFIIFILLLFTMILTDYLDIGDTQNIIEYKSGTEKFFNPVELKKSGLALIFFIFITNNKEKHALFAYLVYGNRIYTCQLVYKLKIENRQSLI